MSAETRRGKPKKRVSRARSRLRKLLPLSILMALAAILGCCLYAMWLLGSVSSRFDSPLWPIPSEIFSAPQEISAGSRLTAADVAARLDRMGYRRSPEGPLSAGEYRIAGSKLDLRTRPFEMPRRHLTATTARLAFVGGLVTAVSAPDGRRMSGGITLEPELLARLYGAQREDRLVLPLDRFPRNLVDAVIAAEDRRFFEHHGLDPVRILSALWTDLRRGEVVQGGSTITQQTIKNLFLGPERTIPRKLREALMAIALEARYPKSRILEVYLNEIYLGQRGSSSVCGFGEAARFFFGKDVSDLDLSECATLAGLIPSPARANPFADPARARERRDAVLKAMLEQGFITEAEMERAHASEIHLASGSAGFSRAPGFVQMVREELSATYGEAELTRGGLRIFTTLDTLMQEKAEDSLSGGLARLERQRPGLVRRDGEPLEGAMVTMRSNTGEVLALVGGRDFGRSQFNRATQARRQPGSLFKPFVYLAGFERSARDRDMKFTPVTLLDDSPISLVSGGRVWSPSNYDDTFRGPVSVRQALEESLNVPAVRAAQLVGVDEVISVARRCGILSPLEPYPSIALGAQEVAPIEMAAAFSAIANGGRRVRPTVILDVLNAKNDRLERNGVGSDRAVDAAAAYLTLDLLRGVVDRGTARAVRAAGVTGDCAGKTGTTNDTRDSWFAGLLPDTVDIVWIGYDDNGRTGLTGASGALPVWIDLVRSTARSGGRGVFQEPDGIVRVEVDPETGALATPGCPVTVTEVFIDGTEPTEECWEHGRGFGNWLRRIFHRRTGA